MPLFSPSQSVWSDSRYEWELVWLLVDATAYFSQFKRIKI